jgi:hypothetical protein
LGSLNAQAQAPDDPLSLRAYIEMLGASFHAQDRQWDTYIFVEYLSHCRQETARLPTTQDGFSLPLQQVSQDRAQDLFVRLFTHPYQGVLRIEFSVCNLWIPVVRQGMVCFHSGDLGFSWIFTASVFNDPCGSSLFVSMYIIEMLWASFHAQDRQWDTYIFVDNFSHCRQETARLPTTQDGFSFPLQQVSQDRAQELFARLLTRPYQGVLRIEFSVCNLWIPVVRQGMVCFHSGDLGFSWIFTASVVNDPCGSSLFVSMYISLAFSLR